VNQRDQIAGPGSARRVHYEQARIWSPAETYRWWVCCHAYAMQPSLPGALNMPYESTRQVPTLISATIMVLTMMIDTNSCAEQDDPG
jgi:hypothetical protein